MSLATARARLTRADLEGALPALAPLPWALLPLGVTGAVPLWRTSFAALAVVALALAGLLAVRRARISRIAAVVGLAATAAVLAPWLLSSPFLALAGTVAILATGAVATGPSKSGATVRVRARADRVLLRGRGAAWGACGAAGIVVVTAAPRGTGSDIALLVSLAVSLGYSSVAALLPPAAYGSQLRRILAWLPLLMMVAWLPLGLRTDRTAEAVLAVCAAALLVLPVRQPTAQPRSAWWGPMLDHPARMLLITFLVLSFVGTLLLLMPGMATQRLAPVDAAFTAVSATCVTGLIVVDTPHAFRGPGQAVILVLIQLGGLGIMGLSSAALHALGRRMTLRQEHLLHAMAEVPEGGLANALVVVVRFTFAAEVIGALVLLPQFLAAGDALPVAAWRALFTAVSAFCNAGFALQSDSLESYAHIPLVLHTVAALIIAGGVAPAVAVRAPDWVLGRTVSASTRLVLLSSLALLVAGFVLITALEWSGALGHLGTLDRLHNAWFQSVTLRTAGFNSVAIDQVTTPTLTVMMLFMFIGGSPGGTAGGVKTATIGVLVLAMAATVRGRGDAVLHGRRIPPALVYRAVAIVAAGTVAWFVLLLALEVTQAIPARDLVFEATSALGTVGLTTGATAKLDGIGKVIIMVGMLIGRVGPLTLFMLLRDDPRLERYDRPDAEITLS